MPRETILERNGDAETCEDCSERCGRCARKCQIDFYYDEYGTLVHPDWEEIWACDYVEPSRIIDSYANDYYDDHYDPDIDDEWWAHDPDMFRDIE